MRAEPVRGGVRIHVALRGGSVAPHAVEYLDTVFVARGPVVATLETSSFNSSFPEALERRLTDVLEKRARRVS